MDESQRDLLILAAAGAVGTALMGFMFYWRRKKRREKFAKLAEALEQNLLRMHLEQLGKLIAA